MNCVSVGFFTYKSKNAFHLFDCESGLAGLGGSSARKGRAANGSANHTMWVENILGCHACIKMSIALCRFFQRDHLGINDFGDR